MRQMVMTEPGKLDLKIIEAPRPDEDEVLVRVMRIGICGSDVHVYHGKHPFTSYPVVQGHEVSGVVEAVGKDVKGIGIGDMITLIPQVVCGECWPCTHGRYHICEHLRVMGFQAPGAAQDLVVLKGENILKLPSTLSSDKGALIEPLAVAVHAIERAGGVEDKNVLVTGAGPIGNLVAQVALGSGADTVMITDISPFRLDIAGKAGIEHAIDVSNCPLKEGIRDVMGSSGADVILECSGSPLAISEVITMARKGSRLIIVAVFEEKVGIDLSLIQDRELELVGTLMYQRRDYERAVDLIEEGRVKPAYLITDYFDFEDYGEAYKCIDKKKDRIMKVMIRVSD